jgi:hypothetical protein
MQLQHFYLRDYDNRPFGVLALFSNPETEQTQVGLSLCHNSDNFNKEVGRKIAIGRAQHGRDHYSTSISWNEEVSWTLYDLLEEICINPLLPKNLQTKGFDAVMDRMDYDAMSKTWKVAFRKSTPREEAAA